MSVNLADLTGSPFVNGGRGPAGYDCWGLACEVFRRFGIELPDYRIDCHDSAAIAEAIDADKFVWRLCRPPYPVPSLVVARFNSILCNHVGSYIGHGRMLHTAEKTGARVDRLDHPYWRRHIEGIHIPGWLP